MGTGRGRSRVGSNSTGMGIVLSPSGGLDCPGGTDGAWGEDVQPGARFASSEARGGSRVGTRAFWKGGVSTNGILTTSTTSPTDNNKIHYASNLDNGNTQTNPCGLGVAMHSLRRGTMLSLSGGLHSPRESNEDLPGARLDWITTATTPPDTSNINMCHSDPEFIYQAHEGKECEQGKNGSVGGCSSGSTAFVTGLEDVVVLEDMDFRGTGGKAAAMKPSGVRTITTPPASIYTLRHADNQCNPEVKGMNSHQYGVYYDPLDRANNREEYNRVVALDDDTSSNQVRLDGTATGQGHMGHIELLGPSRVDYEHLPNGLPILQSHMAGMGQYGPFLWLVNRSEQERQAQTTAFCCLKIRAARLVPEPTFIVAADRCMQIQGQPPKIIKMYGAFQNPEDFVNNCLAKTNWRCFYETIQEGRPCKGHFDVEAKGVSIEEGVKLLDTFMDCLQSELRSRWPKAELECPGCFKPIILCGSRASKGWWKASYHVVLPKLIFRHNTGVLKAVATSIAQCPELQYMDKSKDGTGSFSFVDKTIYTRNRQFRLPLCWKLDDNSKTPFVFEEERVTLDDYKAAVISDIRQGGWLVPEVEAAMIHSRTSKAQPKVPATPLKKLLLHSQSPGTCIDPKRTENWEAIIHILRQLSPVLEQGFSHVANTANFSWPSAIEHLPLLPNDYPVGTIAGEDFNFQDLKQFATHAEQAKRKWKNPLATGHLTGPVINWAISSMAGAMGSGQIWLMGGSTVVLDAWALPTILRNGRGRNKIIQRIQAHFPVATQLLIPANLNNIHWYLIRLRFQERAWSVLDSSPEICKRARKTQITALKESLDGLLPRSATNEESDSLLFEDVSLNSSGVDCAIHVILTIFQISCNGNIRLSKADVTNARRWLLWLILWDLWKAQQLASPPSSVVPTVTPPLQAPATEGPAQVQICTSTQPPKHRGQPRQALQRMGRSRQAMKGASRRKVISRDTSGNYLVQLKNGLLCSFSYENLKGLLLEFAESVHTTQDFPAHRLIGMDANGNYKLAIGRQPIGSVTPADMRAHLDRLAHEANQWSLPHQRHVKRQTTLPEYFLKIQETDTSGTTQREVTAVAVPQVNHLSNVLHDTPRDMGTVHYNRHRELEPPSTQSHEKNQDLRLPLFFARSNLVPIVSLNVGRAGISKSFMQLQQIFASRPGVVMFQETWLKKSAIPRFCEFARKMVPGYSIFTKTTSRECSKDENLQVITFVHGALAARSSQLEIAQFTEECCGVPINELCTNLQCIRTTDLFTEKRILLVNIYQFQSSQHNKQKAMLHLLSKIIDRERPHVEEILIGGDWNASLEGRTGYSTDLQSDTRLADIRLQKWLEMNQLNLVNTPTWTWEGINRASDQIQRASLDFFVTKSHDLQCFVCPSPDPAHDHRLVCIGIPNSLISPLPELPRSSTRGRLNMSKWLSTKPGSRSPKEEWKTSLSEALKGLTTTDKTERIQKALELALESAEQILGLSKPRQMSHIPFHSSEAKRLLSLRRDARAAITDIRSRLMATADSTMKMSKAMRKAWDRQWIPPSLSHHMANQIILHKEIAREWTRLLLGIKSKMDTEFKQLRASEISQARKESIVNAITRMNTPGSKEIKRLMGKVAEKISAPYFESEVPSTVVVDDIVSSPFADNYIQSFAPHSKRTTDGNKTTISGIPPDKILGVLRVLKCENLTFALIEHVSASNSIGYPCCTIDEKLASTEYHLAEAALATKARCPRCHRLQSLVPLSDKRHSRQVVHWCKVCNTEVEPMIKADDYQDIPFDTAGVPKIPRNSSASLRGPISIDDLQWHLLHLGRRKAPGADGIPNEFLIEAPESLLTIILDFVNSLLAVEEEDRIMVPSSWKDGLVRSLYKGGSPIKHSNWRPVTLLRTVYKVYSAVLTDRLSRIASTYNLIHPSQEGFQRDHCTQRNVQSLLWAYEQAQREKGTLIVHFVDFANAFNSMDHMALWRWLEEINIPDIDLLRDIYLGSFYQADTDFGLSAKVTLTRGGKQGDRLTPILFLLFFNGLLYSLDHLNIGPRSSTGSRVPSKGFADDLAILTTSKAEALKGLEAVEKFGQWSGMRMNVNKTRSSAKNFKTNRDIDLSSVTYELQPIVQIPSNKSFKYLGVHVAMTQDWKEERKHIFSSCQALSNMVHKHQYIPDQMVRVIEMITTAQFRYSAALVPWTGSELNRLYGCWIRLHKAAWRLPNYKSFPNAQFHLPSARGGRTISHPLVHQLHALDIHMHSLSLWDDHIRTTASQLIKNMMMGLKASSCEECMVALEHEQNLSTFGVFGRFFKLAHLFHLQAELPKRLLNDIPDWPSWMTLQMKFRDCWKRDYPGIHKGRPTDEVMAEWRSDVRKMCQEGYSSPGCLPGTVDPFTLEKTTVIPPFIKAQIGPNLSSTLEGFLFKTNGPPNTTTLLKQTTNSAPVAPLSRERISIILENPTDNTYWVQNFKITNSRNAARIEERTTEGSWQFVGTVPRGRLGFLLSFSEPSQHETLLSKVKDWIAQAQAITQNSSLSWQVLHDIQMIAGSRLYIGENPLTAPSCFPSSWSNVTEKEGWMDKEDDWKSALILLPSLQSSSQTDAGEWISAKNPQHWLIVTNEETPIPLCLRPVTCKIMDLDSEAPILRKHKGITLKQQWESKLSKSKWSIWCSMDTPSETQHRIQSELSRLGNRWTRRGVVHLMKHSPFYREAKFTEEGYLYETAKYVAGSDGSVSQGDCLGFANVWLNESLPTSYGTSEGMPSSQKVELAGILAAVSAPPLHEDVAVCTDSLSSLQLLNAMQRADFPLEIRTHINFKTLVHIVQAINQRSEAGGHTTLMKVAAHSGNSLNEWADAEASQAFSKAPQLEHCDSSTQFDCQYLLPQGQGPPFPVVWGTRIKRYASQLMAQLQLSKRTESTSNRSIRSITELFLCREGQNRHFLGSWLSECKDSRMVQSVLMACGDFYPCHAKLFQWKLRNSPGCSLCHDPYEDSCHIQCVCPLLERSRIQAHHSVWCLTFSKIQEHLKKECSTVREESVNSWHLIESPEKYDHIAKRWKSALRTIKDGSNTVETGDHLSATIFLTNLADQIADTYTKPEDCKDLISAAMEQAQQLHVQLDGASSACGDASNIGSFTFMHKYPILKAIYEERNLQELIQSEISRKRPDGLVVNWKRQRFFVLEFTRAYDKNAKNVERTEMFKKRKYTPMCDIIAKALGPPWVGEVVTFTAGVRGSLQTKTWEQNLTKIGVSKLGIDKVINSATKSTLEQCHFMYQAREAALKLAERT